MKRTIKQFQVEDVARAYDLTPDQIRHAQKPAFGSYAKMAEACERASRAFQALKDAVAAIEEEGHELD